MHPRIVSTNRRPVMLNARRYPSTDEGGGTWRRFQMISQR